MRGLCLEGNILLGVRTHLVPAALEAPLHWLLMAMALLSCRDY